MSYHTKVDGTITIDPPIRWADFRNIAEELRDTAFVVDLDTMQTDDGTVTRKSAVGIIAVNAEEEMSRRWLFEELGRLAATFSASCRFGGFLEVTSREDDAEVWRYYIRLGRAIEVKPMIVWPTVGDNGDLLYAMNTETAVLP